ncbi:ABC transporter ATP-binding protein [Amycolatopsis magusensis]|uniref:ABC-2 type transport system ATP-binding protein n=1 Tax=Amycolatopsis magusensis TaxID=882444 RepID=A0ABS4PR57_9PSEU|nr:ATP-binding cassette domain-containing protein [Amycolatopsis magusensis]MBP2181906.1 ABC-2 type transport system ATP-binding protein [Amycolatopsis magusensis]
MIEARELVKKFGGTVAVDGLSFDVRPGVVTGFLGPNGAGKSTTMRMVLGLDRPTRGVVTVNGKSSVDLPAPPQEVGAVLDAKAVHSGRSAHAHLKWMAQAGGIPVRRVDEVLGQVGLTSVAGKRAGDFSLGMSQRLGIAGALLGDPATLLFDEPVNGLDPEGIQWIRTLMRDLAAQGRTVFVSSHLMNEMEETADHVLVIGRGRLIADLPITELTSRSAHAHVRVHAPEAARLGGLLTEHGGQVRREAEGVLLVTGLDAAWIGDFALAQRIAVHELTTVRASLEAAFLELTAGAAQYSTQREEIAETARALAEEGSR